MNHAYRLVWTGAARCVVAGLGSTWLATAQANPTGGTVVAGDGTINQNGTTTTVRQQTQNLSVNWLDFNIASAETVRFIQPSASAIALNRVTGNNASQIYGHLLANGQVFLINPNGVLFGRGAQVNVGGLVASTLNITDADFLAGNYKFQGSVSNTSGTSSPGTVINQGTITADGGSVALLGGQVSNQGTVRAQLGTVALAAGSAMTLDFRGNKLLNVKVDQSAVGALVENRQLIQADGGTVIMTATARDALLNTVINNTGVIEARTLQEQDGQIKLLGGVDGGAVKVDGTLDASAPDGGNGGSIETSGDHVKVADTAIITTRAAHGQSGNWLIDPPDFTVAASGGDITGATLATALDNGNVTILSSQGTVNIAGSGDINVNDDVIWNNPTTLTLSAVRNVNVNAVIANTTLDSGSTINLRADSGGACVAGTAVCGTVNIDSASGFFIQADNVNIYYNPVGSNNAAGTNGSGPSYSTPTDYTAGVIPPSGVFNVFMLVNDVNQLQAINADPGTRSYSYALGRDIDATAASGWNGGAGFVPIGASGTGQQFAGTFDGLGHSITGLNINRPGTSYVGLFGYAAPAAVIQNVGLSGGSITGAANVGSLAGWNRGAILNTYSSAAVTGTNLQVGGLVGVNQGSVSSSHATGSVSAQGVVGGLVGWDNAASITTSYATGNVTSTLATGYGVGGLVGYMFGNSTISRSYASGNVSSVGQYAGGLVGDYDSNGLAPTILDSYATGSVHGTAGVGGLVGAKLRNSGSIVDSYATGAVSGTSFVGGLVGSWAGGTITASFWDTQGTGQSTSAGGGRGMTTAQMHTRANFTSATAANGNVNPGWNFAADWRMYDGHTAPLLEAYLTPLTVTAQGVSRMYSGASPVGGLLSPTYSVAGADTSGHLLGLDSPYAGDRNVGVYAPGLWSDQQGYDITVVGGTLTITKAPLVLSTSSVRKTYDGTMVAAGTPIATGGTTLYGGDSLSGGTFAYTDRNVGTGNKTVTVSGVTVNDGNGGNNYSITYNNNTTSTIDPATLTITAAANSRPYDGTTAAAAAPTVTGLISGDSVTGLTEEYTNRNAGTGKTLTVTNYAVNDSNGGNNYTVSTVDSNTGVIDKATLALTTSDVTKTYDGTTSAAGSLLFSGGTHLFGTDSLSGGTFAFADKNVGNGDKIVTPSGVIVSDGNSGNNYSIAYVGNTTSTINPAALMVSTGSVTKTYDGTTSAIANAMVAGDTKLFGADSLSGGTFAYTDKNAGSGNKTVTVSGVTVNDGNGGNNYVVTYSSNTSSTIKPAALTVSGAAVANKTYDGTRAASISGGVLSGLVGGDSVSLAQSAQFADSNAGANKNVAEKFSLSGGDAANYVLASEAAQGVATIAPKALTITANDQTRPAGAPNPAFTLTYSGFVIGESDANLTAKPSASTPADAASPAGQYAIAVSGAVDPNYRFTYVPGVLTVTGSPPPPPPVVINLPPGYVGALASVRPVEGSGTLAAGASNTDNIPESISITPFSEEWAYNQRTHANDYLPGLSLEILNGGIKMPPGVP